MATKKKDRCKRCDKPLPCYEHCQEARTGLHEVDPLSAVQADDTEMVVDYNCKRCGQSGGVAVNPADIQWS